jgi:hypothetical protein
MGSALKCEPLSATGCGCVPDAPGLPEPGGAAIPFAAGADQLIDTIFVLY